MVKSFKAFITKHILKDKDGRIVVNSPVHYKYSEDELSKDKDGRIIVDSPVHYKDISELKEGEKEYTDVGSPLHDIDIANRKLHGNSDTLTSKLRKHISKDEDRKAIYKYTSFNSKGNNGSLRMNKKLAKGADPEKLHASDKPMHDAIMKHAKPAGHQFHALSGTHQNFEEMSKKGNTDKFHFPAHTSTTHDRETAENFARGKAKSDSGNGIHHHILHVHVKKHNKILHTAPYSEFPEEHETIIPAGTNMTYHGTSKHKDEDGNHWHTHHFTIDD